MEYVKCKFSVKETFYIDTIVKGFEVEEYFYYLTKDGRLMINRGYPWDGASGAFDTENIIKASCIHDIFCEMINAEQLPQWVQALADEEFRRIELAEGMGTFRRVYTYLAVRVFQLRKQILKLKDKVAGNK